MATVTLTKTVLVVCGVPVSPAVVVGVAGVAFGCLLIGRIISTANSTNSNNRNTPSKTKQSPSDGNNKKHKTETKTETSTNTSSSNQKENNNEKDAPRRRGRGRTPTINDPSSTTNEDMELDVVFNHLLSRFTRFFRLGGIIQRISGITGISRTNIIQPGGSQYQDRNSSTPGWHAAHVIRAGTIHSSITGRQRTELENFLGHTQDVPRWANVDKIGQLIDQFQSENLNELAKIDFSGELNSADKIIIIELIKKFVAMLGNCIKYMRENRRGQSNEQLQAQIGVIQELRDYLDCSKEIIELMFKKGKKGYSGENMSDYQNTTKNNRKKQN
uniref:Putative hyp37.3 secreted salivary gland protein n=1 Tax=Corethrella appendiculata TaxID=1370023 RepID=U5ELQ7_9DIPT